MPPSWKTDRENSADYISLFIMFRNFSIIEMLQRSFHNITVVSPSYETSYFHNDHFYSMHVTSKSRHWVSCMATFICGRALIGYLLHKICRVQIRQILIMQESFVLFWQKCMIFRSTFFLWTFSTICYKIKTLCFKGQLHFQPHLPT
jgi:hypothetical protein